MFIPIIGNTGTGKTRSFKGLNPKETFIILCENKGLSFDKNGERYKLGENLAVCLDYGSIVNKLKELANQKGKWKNIVIDDAGIPQTKDYRKVAHKEGWDKFIHLALNLGAVHLTVTDLFPREVLIFVTYHEETDKYNKTIISSVGNMFNKDFDPLKSCDVALQTIVTFNEKGLPDYKFATNTFRTTDGKVTLSKSPEEMFGSLLIDNDLGIVEKAIRTYHNI